MESNMIRTTQQLCVTIPGKLSAFEYCTDRVFHSSKVFAQKKQVVIQKSKNPVYLTK